MRFTTPASNGPAAVGHQLQRTEIPSSPFTQSLALSALAGPTYSDAQTLVQQVAYALCDRLFTYSPDSFNLDTTTRAWRAGHEKNAYGGVTGVQVQETRSGAGNIALGYMFSSDFDLNKRHIPQAIIANTGSLQYLRPCLEQLSLLYDVANPTVLQVAAIDYAPDTKAGLVADYCSALTLAEELGFALVASKSVYEIQHMSLLSTLLSSILPSMHTYDGITVGREITRVIDVLSVDSLRRAYDTVFASFKANLGAKRLSNEAKASKLLQAFNDELGTEYKCFEYHGHQHASSAIVVFGTVEASLSAQIAEALAERGVEVGVINVRVYRPFLEKEFLQILPDSVQHISVLGQVNDHASVSDFAIPSCLYSDVLAAVSFHSLATGKEVSVHDVKYSRGTVWTPRNMEDLVSQLGSASLSCSQDRPTRLLAEDVQQYIFWDLDRSQSATAPAALAQLLSSDSSLNVALRSGHDNLAQGGATRTDIRSSVRSVEAAWSVENADVVVVGDSKLLTDFNIIGNVRDGGIAIIRVPGWKDEDVEIKLNKPARRALAGKHVNLLVLDPSVSVKVSENSELESYLVQLAFLKVARADLYENGLQKLKVTNPDLQALAEDLDLALKKIEVQDSWLEAEPEPDQTLPPADDINVNSFSPLNTSEEETATLLRTWVDTAKGLAFREAHGTKIALRPDVGVKTAVVHVKEHRRLTPETYDRNIFHIEFDLGNSGLRYEIGEALGIHAENDKDQVEDFIQWYSLNPEDIVEVPNRDDADLLEKRTVYQALRQNVDIFGRPPKRFYEALSAFASDEKEKTSLYLLGTGGNQEASVEFKRRAEVDTITYADVLLEFPSAHPSFQEIVRIISPMKRREYSIASSQKVTPNSVSLLVVTVNWVDPKGRDRFGQATRYLNGLEIGAPVTVSVKPSVMKLPPRTTQPLIMAGLGTGLAPFRAFVQERAWQKQQGMPIGNVFLYMGSRHQREEYLYGEEWEAYQAAGIITHMGCAFSRDQPQKIYIQDRMRQSLDQIRRVYLREEGAFYLCGPTWPVPDVTTVLEEAVEVEARAEGKKKDGHKEIERLKEELRYVLEVY